MKYRKHMSRRTFLRGAGTVAIGLPLLDAMRTTSVFAASPEPPVRAFNVFFGLGLPTPLQAEGFDGPLEPLSPLADRLAIVRGVNHRRVDDGGVNAHFDGAAGAFTAERPNGEALAGGISLDQALRRAAYPNGLPTGVIPTLLMGTYFRRSRPARYVHSWNQDGSPADLPVERPEALFSRIFGEDPAMGGDDLTPEEERRLRLQRSILDSTIEQYRHLQSDASNLGVASRARIADHLDQVREYERRVFGDGGINGCTRPPAPDASTIPHDGGADPDGEGIDITVDELVNEWRLMVDLYTLAVRCDLVRFGSITFQAAGERIRLSGSYDYDGRRIYDFDDRGERGVGGSQGCSHEFWHEFREANANTQLRAHAHLMQREVAYFLSRLDDAADADVNGLTILQNAMITVSTESGDGRHNDVPRELSGVMHAISGANQRFRTGQIIDVDVEGIDLYNTMLAAYGVGAKLGPADRAVNEVTAILR